MAQKFSTSGAVQVVIENVPEVRKALQELGTRASRRVARKALRAGLAPVVKAIRAETKAQTERVTGRLSKSPGQRIVKEDKANNYIFKAKAGLNVGKKKVKLDESGKKVATGNYAPHAHLVALGTKMRFTKNGKSTGMMKKHPIVPRAYTKPASQSLHAMKRKLDVEIQLEVIKARVKAK